MVQYFVLIVYVIVRCWGGSFPIPYIQGIETIILIKWLQSKLLPISILGKISVLKIGQQNSSWLYFKTVFFFNIFKLSDLFEFFKF